MLAKHQGNRSQEMLQPTSSKLVLSYLNHSLIIIPYRRSPLIACQLMVCVFVLYQDPKGSGRMFQVRK